MSVVLLVSDNRGIHKEKELSLQECQILTQSHKKLRKLYEASNQKLQALERRHSSGESFEYCNWEWEKFTECQDREFEPLLNVLDKILF